MTRGQTQPPPTSRERVDVDELHSTAVRRATDLRAEAKAIKRRKVQMEAWLLAAPKLGEP